MTACLEIIKPDKKQRFIFVDLMGVYESNTINNYALERCFFIKTNFILGKFLYLPNKIFDTLRGNSQTMAVRFMPNYTR